MSVSAAEDSRQQGRDSEGVAYGRPPARHDPLISEVGPGTPLGEFMRRYWHPVALSADVTSRPRKVRILGEDLIIFRDGKGQPGLLYPRCMHRGTTLYYGRVEDRGIRCCYHGWLFDVQGRCLEQPCEPDGGTARDRVRQPWYPVQERYGMVFAYLGPPEAMPILPRYSNLENLAEGFSVYTDGGDGRLAYGDTDVVAPTAPFNWLQVWENIMDPYHVWILHSTLTETHQFEEEFKIRPRVDFRPFQYGVAYDAYRNLDDGTVLRRTSYAMLPNVASIPAINLELGTSRTVVWFVPVDDTNFVMFRAHAGQAPRGAFRIPLMPDGRSWGQMTEEEHQDYPSDFEAQGGQGPISLHSEEHLVQSDIGIGMLRRLLRQQVRGVEEGRAPLGADLAAGSETIEVISGNYIEQ